MTSRPFALILLAFALSTAASASTTRAQPLIIHVATWGNDSQDGQEKSPFATPARAARAVRELKRANGGMLPREVLIEFEPGKYELAEPLVLTPDDSGTADAPVTWAARFGDKVVFSGGTVVTDWQPTQLNGREVWTAKTTPGMVFRSLGGVEAVRARHPNKTHLTIPTAPEPDAAWDAGQFQFQYTDGNVPAFTTDDAEVVTFGRWVQSRLPLLRNDVRLRELRFTRRSVYRTEAGDIYRIENAPEFLDEPGEWYARYKTGEVFYLPRQWDSIKEFKAVVPRLPQLVRLEGKPEAGQFVEHVTFRGIGYSDAEWQLPARGTEADGRPQRGGFEQAAHGVPGAVWAQGARHCAFERCYFLNVGNYGLELSRGCQDNRVAACTFRTGAGGIKIGEKVIRQAPADQVCRNTVIDCRILGYGKLFADGVGILIGESYDNRVAHNLIRNGFYTAISIGWTWGYDPTPARGNVIEHNHVHHIGQLEDGTGPVLSDMGAVYTLGTQPGTVIRNNHFHHMEGRVYGGWGIYFDEGTSNVLAERNLVHTTSHGGFHQHFGRDNVVRNNVFGFGRTRQIERSRSEDHRSFTFEHNVVVWDEGVGIAGNWDNFNATFRWNQYWPYGKAEPLFGYMGFEQWRGKGMDEGSVVADPGFIDAKNGDYRFKQGGGPVGSVRFEPWNFDDVGPRRAPN